MEKIKTIVLDVDDTMLDYTGGFRDYCNRYYSMNLVGLPANHSFEGWFEGAPSVKAALLADFNSTWCFGTLKPLDMAGNLLRTFSRGNNNLEDPFKLVIITKCGSSDMTSALRKVNLEHVFGPLFDDITFLNFNESKKGVLSDLQKDHDIVLFVDDYVQNCVDSADLGIPSVVMRHSTNLNITPRYDIPVAEDWIDLFGNYLKPLLTTKEESNE